MTPRNHLKIFPTILSVLACFAVAPLAEAKPGEDRGNGNSAAEHVDALDSLTTGSNNTAHGWFSLFSDTSGSSNTADGFKALYSNTTGTANTAIGDSALLNNDISGFGLGNFNTAVGTETLFSNNDGDSNTAIGYTALRENQSGESNVAIGQRALLRNDVTGTGFGSFNTAVGAQALEQNIDGGFNVAVGSLAGFGITTGSVNVVVGDFAGAFIDTGNNIIAIGAGVTGVSTGLGQLDNSCYIGNIHGQPIDPAGAPLAVSVDADGKLGTMLSSRRFKKDIKPINQASEVLLALKPVTFHYNNDKKCTPQFGLIAEDVAKVNSALVVRDKNGDLLSVRYDAVNAMLLNEFLKEYRKNEQQEATIARQQKQIDALAAGLQKVSAQLELSKPAPQTVLNNQ